MTYKVNIKQRNSIKPKFRFWGKKSDNEHLTILIQ